MSGVLVRAVVVSLALVVVGCSAVNEPSKPLSVAAEVTPIAVVASKSASKSVTLLDRVVWNAQKQQGKLRGHQACT